MEYRVDSGMSVDYYLVINSFSTLIVARESRMWQWNFR